MITGKWIRGIDDISDAKRVRTRVFVEEQGFAEEIEFDRYDQIAWHAVLYDEGEPVATGRLYISEGLYRLGRICVNKDRRGQYLGDLLIRMLLKKAVDMRADAVWLDAQTRVKGFYEKFGFRAEGEEFDDEGVPHVKMKAKREDIAFPSKCSGS